MQMIYVYIFSFVQMYAYNRFINTLLTSIHDDSFNAWYMRLGWVNRVFLL